MSNEQLDAVKDQLLSEDNAEIREKISSVYLEDPERGAEMIIAFASDKGLKLDATADEVVNQLEKIDDDEDMELTPEMLASLAGGRGRRGRAPRVQTKGRFFMNFLGGAAGGAG